MPAILGISPGTQHVGVAVIKEERLTHSKVQTFRGSWSDAKRKAIMYFLNQSIDGNKVVGVAIKIPDELPVSEAYIQLLGAMNALFERKGIKAVYYTLADLKKHYCPDRKINKAVLAECVAAKYPDLHFELRKEQSNGNPYYHKVFEAVAAAHLLRKTRD